MIGMIGHVTGIYKRAITMDTIAVDSGVFKLKPSIAGFESTDAIPHRDQGTLWCWARLNHKRHSVVIVGSQSGFYDNCFIGLSDKGKVCCGLGWFNGMYDPGLRMREELYLTPGTWQFMALAWKGHDAKLSLNNVHVMRTFFGGRMPSHPIGVVALSSDGQPTFPIDPHDRIGRCGLSERCLNKDELARLMRVSGRVVEEYQS